LAAVLLALPLLVSTATAAPSTDDTHPLAKRHTAAKPKPAAPVLATPQSAIVPATALAAERPAAIEEPQTVQLKGIVLNTDGRPCAGASVYPVGAPRQLVVTDAQGAFSLPVPAGVPVAVRAEYFGEGSSRVEVPSPGTEVLRIKLGR